MKENRDLTTHWNTAYTGKEITELGWYEENPEPSLGLITDLNLPSGARIFNAGTGASTLIDELVNLGYEGLIANDLSEVALAKLKDRLGERQNKVSWIVDDLLNPKSLKELEPIDLWHDRAVLHFFTEHKDQDKYFALLKSLLAPGGYVILAAFNLEGAKKCCGLPVFRYDQNMMSKKLGDEFKMIKSFNYTFQNPSGDSREYVYTVFMRQKV